MPRISLAAARVNAKMTQAEAAKALNISKNTIISWEKGDKSPRYNQLVALCELYNMPLDYIFLPYTLPIVEKTER